MIAQPKPLRNHSFTQMHRDSAIQNPRGSWRWMATWAFLIGTGLIAGCGGDNRLEVRLIGHLEGPLRTASDQTLKPTSTGNKRVPIVIGEANFDSADRSYIAAAYHGGTPVALFNATVEEVNLLREIVGLPKGFVFPSGISVADVYALDKSTSEKRYEFALYPLPPADGAPNQTEPLSGGTGSLDSAKLQSARMNALLRWLQDDEARDTVSDDARVSAQDLTEAKAQPQDIPKNFSEQHEVVYQQQGVLYTITFNMLTNRLATGTQPLRMAGRLDVAIDPRDAVFSDTDLLRGRMLKGFRIAAVPYKGGRPWVPGTLVWSDRGAFPLVEGIARISRLGDTTNWPAPFVDPEQQNGWAVDYYGLPTASGDGEANCALEPMNVWNSSKPSKFIFHWTWIVDDRDRTGYPANGMNVILMFEGILRTISTRGQEDDWGDCREEVNDETTGRRNQALEFITF
jgi:hypothetical protein